MEALTTHTIKPRVLVIRLSSMGDLVLATAVLEPLQAAGFDAFFVTKKAFAPLLEQNSMVKGIFAFDSKQGERAAREQFYDWAKAQNFSLILDLQDSWRTRLWRWHLRGMAEVRVARKERLREWMILLLRLGNFFSFGRGGRAKKFRRLAIDAVSSRGVFTFGKKLRTKLDVTPEERELARALLPKGDFVVVLPGSAWKGKEWPYFPELARVMALRAPVVALGSDKDLVCDEVAQFASGHPESRSLRGKTSLRQSMAVIAEAKWVIGNDTGMVHVAEAMGKDVAMVEGPTHEWMGFSPYREGSVLLGLPLICRPCSKAGRFCPRFGTRKCLHDLKVSTVVAQLQARGYPC